MNQGLFEYDPGDGKKRLADPFDIHHQLVLAFFEISGGRSEEAVVKLWHSENPVQKAEAVGFLEKVSRKVFKLIPFNGMTGEGCTPRQAVQLYWDYFTFCDQKKTANGVGNPTSPSSTGPTSSIGPETSNSPSG